jgi:hypothetical protein
MADSAILGLFTTPEQYQLAQQKEQQARAIQYANLNPMARANYGVYRAGQQLGNTIGGLLGVQDPQMQLISSTQQIARSANLADPDSLEATAQQLANIGNMPLAISYADRAKALREEKRKGLESESKINLQTAQTEKAKKFEQQQQVSTQNRTIISAIEEKLATDPTYVPTSKEMAQARFVLGSEMKTRTLIDPVTGALLGTIDGMDINFSAPNLARLLAKQQPVKQVEGAATSTDGVATTSAVVGTTTPVAEAIPAAVGDTTTTASGLKVTETPASIQKEKERKEKEVIKIEEDTNEANALKAGIDNIASVRKLITETKNLVGTYTTGLTGKVLAYGSTPARSLENKNRRIQSNAVFEELIRLKSESKTGSTGFGALNLEELRTIQNKAGNLDPVSPSYLQDLQDIDDYFAKIQNILSEKSGRAEELLSKKPTPTPVSKDKEARIKILVDRAMADPRVDKKASRAQVEATIRARPEFKE